MSRDPDQRPRAEKESCVKLLVYGGCHALILKRLVDTLGPAGGHEVEALINFQLIGEGRPFPYERLGAFDAVVFSPIENKGAYNTDALAAQCRQAGVPAICYPWLEWHGYCPGAQKGEFWGHRQWFYPDLIDLRHRFDDLDAFVRHVRAEYPSEAAIRRVTDISTRMLTEQERRNACAVTISDVIAERFRHSRLFLISDHPALPIYRSVIEQLERLLGVVLVPSWPGSLPEPQPEERTPIFPRVAEALGLRFSDARWRSEARPQGEIGLDDYLALYFHHGEELATACRPTRLLHRSDAADACDPVAVAPFTQVLIRRSSPAGADHFAGDILAPIADAASLRLSGPHLFRKDDWLCRS